MSKDCPDNVKILTLPFLLSGSSMDIQRLSAENAQISVDYLWTVQRDLFELSKDTIDIIRLLVVMFSGQKGLL